ncbi:MAG TPA: metal-dependent hydrolase [Halococcus sp.]|nr:metal-dependent hydrolase [Halococcus sp.]
MFPWGHIAVGYLCYSLLTHLRGRTPTGISTVALVIGTQFPDLVDKPLSWSFDLLPAGVFAHTVFVAIPVSVLVLVVGRRYARTELGVAFAVGYLSHLPADVLPSVIFSDDPSYWFLFWPVIPRPGVDVSNPIVGPGAGAGLLTNAQYYFLDYVHDLLGSPQELLYVGAYLVLFGAIFALWLYDGHPGTGVIGRAVCRVAGRSSS